jgi:hypothetical protein
MKKLILPLLIFSVSTLVAQNYQNICSPGTTLFRGPNQYFEAFRRDSVHISGNNDSVFYSYRAIRDSMGSGGCKDTSNGDAFGRRVIKKSNGWFYFFNMKQDTIKLKTNASINEAWRYCSLPGNGYIEATVTSLLTDSVAGTTDQVKVISLQSKNPSGISISGIFNQKKIKLSQNYGLSEIYDLYMTPYDTVKLSLIGKTSQQLGVQPLTWADVYNLDIGDEFHYYYDDDYAWSSKSKRIDRIIGKTIYGNMDSVMYLVDECRKTWYAHPPPPYPSQVRDTVTWKYNFIQMASDISIRYLPDEFLGVAAFTQGYGQFNNRQTQTVNLNGYSYSMGGTQNCITYPFEVWGPVSTYVKGLGFTNWLYEWDDMIQYIYYFNLVYYKKGSEIWGTPLASDCSVFLNTSPDAVREKAQIEVYPNPSSGEVTITLNGSSSGNIIFMLCDLSGRKVLDGTAMNNPFQLSTSTLAIGMYILNIYNEDGNILVRSKILIR